MANALRKKQMHNQEADDEEAQLPELQVLLYSSRRFGPKSIRELTVPPPDTSSVVAALQCMRLRCQSSESRLMAACPLGLETIQDHYQELSRQLRSGDQCYTLNMQWQTTHH